MRKRIAILICLAALIVPAASAFANPPRSPGQSPAPAGTNSIQTDLYRQQILDLASRRRSPFVGSMFTLAYAGAGQFYNGDYSKGSLFFLGETVYIGLFYGMRLKFQTTYGDTISFRALNSADKVLLISSFALYLAFKVYCIRDAYISAVDLNRRIDESMSRIQLSYTPTDVSIRYSLRF